MEELLRQLIRDLGNFRQEVDQRLDAMDRRFDAMDRRFDAMDQRFKSLEQLVNESHQWIRTMLGRQDVQRAENDNQGHKLAKIEGALKGVAVSLEPSKEA